MKRGKCEQKKQPEERKKERCTVVKKVNNICLRSNLPTFLRFNHPAVERKLAADFVEDLVISSWPAHHVLDLSRDAPSDFVESPHHSHLVFQKIIGQRYRGIQPAPWKTVQLFVPDPDLQKV